MDENRKKWCSHYWREDQHGTDFVSPDDREISHCESPKYCPYCGWERGFEINKES